MSYTTQEAFAVNTTYRNQVKVAIQIRATYAVEGNGGTIQSYGVLGNALNAARNPAAFVDWFIYFVAADTTVIADAGSPTDAHIKAVIDAKWVEVMS